MAKTGKVRVLMEILLIYAFLRLILRLVSILGANNIKFVMGIACKIMYQLG